MSETRDAINVKEIRRLISSLNELDSALSDLTEKFAPGDIGNEISVKIESLEIGDIVPMMSFLRVLRDSGKEVSAATQNLYDAFSISVVPEFMEKKGIDTMTANGYRLEVRPGIRVSVLEGQKEALHAWLKEHSMETLITSGVNSSTLKAMVKSALEEGTDYPAEFLKIDAYSQAVIVKK